jgi:hypothetical protein
MTTARRQASRRDLPGLCLLFAAALAAGALGLPLASKLDFAKESDLYSIDGTLLSAPTYISGKGAHLEISLLASDGAHRFAQDDLSSEVPAIWDLHAGDNVILRVKRYSPGLGRFWEIKRNGIAILSYQDTYRYEKSCEARVRKLAYWMGGLSLGLLLLAILLRKHFGAWRDKQTSAFGAFDSTTSG